MVFVRLFVIALLCGGTVVVASDATESMRSAIDELKKKMATESTQAVVESTLMRDGALCPENENVPAKSSFGKVTVGGLTQIWYESVQNDHSGVFHGAPTFSNGAANPPQFLTESNAGNQNDTFRIRRAELRLKIQFSDMISAAIVLDPAREANSLYSPIPTLLRHNSKTTISEDFRNGTVSSFHPSLLQDAYIVVRDFDKGWFDCDKTKAHHTFAIGQFKPPAGEEATRDSGSLDFVERAMVTGVNNVRDIGAEVIGHWFDDRLTYKAGFFNGPSGTVLTDPEVVEAGNRPDDNNAKDIAWSISGLPWNVIDKDTKAWSGLEVGYFRTDGVHGGSGQEFDPNINVLNDINRRRTHISRQGAWAYLKPNGAFRGLWLRGEWGRLHDIYGGDAKTTSLGLGSVDVLNTNVRGSSAFSQANPNPVTLQGWFASVGYKLSDSAYSANLVKCGGTMGKEFNKMEFCFRAEQYQNIATEDLARPDRRTDLFPTRVYTGGMNYQMNVATRIQLNYILVDDPSSRSHFLAEVKNNVFVANFQMKF